MSGSHGGLVIGIDLGGTHMQVGVVDPAGTLIARQGGGTDAEGGFDAIAGQIEQRCRQAAREAGVDLESIAAVGLAAPGAVDPGRGVVLNAPNLRWSNLAAASLLRDRLGVPVLLDNDVNAAVLAEYRLGSCRGEADLLGVWVGTGVGGGLIFGGRVYHGPLFTAGEIGHIIADAKGVEGRRELEHLASRSAISRDIAERVRSGERSLLSEAVSRGQPITAEQITSALDRGDAVVSQVLEQAALVLGVAIGNLVTVLSLRRVVLGGGLVEKLGVRLTGPVQAAARAAAWPEALRGLEVVPTKLGPDAGLLGAAMIARERLGEN
jgi:glucokinase